MSATAEVVDDDRSDDAASAEAQARHPLRGRVWLVVVAATALQLVPRLWGQWGGWFFADDFWRQDAVARSSAWEIAVQGQGGHVEPLTYFLMHAFASVTPFQWAPQVLATAVLWLVTDVVVLLGFRVLWGWGWPTAAAYVVYALSTFTLPSFLWSSQVWLGSMAVLSLALLVVGTLRGADQLGLRHISSESKRLAKKARDKGLTLDEMADSTFTISNLGMFGVSHFNAIINPPNVAILAVGAAIERPVVRDGTVVVGSVMSMTMSSDHRVVDGAMAAAYLATVKGLLEKPAALLV